MRFLHLFRPNFHCSPGGNGGIFIESLENHGFPPVEMDDSCRNLNKIIGPDVIIEEDRHVQLLVSMQLAQWIFTGVLWYQHHTFIYENLFLLPNF
jgi:hypothetical protein